MKAKHELDLKDIINLVFQLPKKEQKELHQIIEENIKETSINRGYGFLKGKIKMSDDFNEPLEDFKEYIN